MMLKKHKLWMTPLAAVSLMSVAGAMASPAPDETVCPEPPEQSMSVAELTPLMRERAARLRQIIRAAPERRCAVYMYERTLSAYAGREEKLAARCRTLGLTDIYYSFGEKHTADPALRDRSARLVALFHRHGFTVHALRFAGVEPFVSDTASVNSARSLLDYNRSVPLCSRFDGAAADLEPQILKKGRPYLPDNLSVLWDGKLNAPGGANDILIRRALSELGLIRRELDGLPLSEALGHFFETRFQKKELSCGGVNDFLRVCDFVVVMAYADNGEKVLRMSEAQLRAAERPRSVAVAVKTSVGTFNDEGAATSLQPKGWDNMTGALDKVVRKAGKYQSFRGVDFFEYAGLEKMWETP